MDGPGEVGVLVQLKLYLGIPVLVILEAQFVGFGNVTPPIDGLRGLHGG